MVSLADAPFNYDWEVIRATENYTIELIITQNNDADGLSLIAPTRNWRFAVPCDSDTLTDTFLLLNPSDSVITLTNVMASVPGVEVTVNGYSNQVAPNGQGSISITGQKTSDTVGQGSVSIHGFYRGVDGDRIAYTLNPSSFTQPDLQPGQTFSKQYVLTPTLFDEGTNYTLSLSDPDMVEQWISLSGPGSVIGGSSIPLTVDATPPAWLQEGYTYAYSASITLTDPDQKSRTGTLHFEVSKTGGLAALHTTFEPGAAPMTTFSLNAFGAINARIIECEEGEDEESGGDDGGWTWESLGGGFRGRRSGGDDAGNSGSGGDNPTTGADGAPAETTGEESQEVSLGLSQSLMLEGESFQATLTLNSIVAQPVTNIAVTLLISDASGADARDLFTIVPASPTDLGDLPGGGQVIGDWLIVPTVEVTRSEGEDFRIRAQLDYDYEGQAYRFTTIEETITVFPAPELIIDYELPEADLVCTTFDLRATFRNVGAGPARNLRLTSGQPRVVKSTGNTPQSFKVTRVAVNGVEVGNATMALDIGDIPPGGFGEVVWRIEAEEAGRFTDFSSDYRMLNYLGEALAPSLRGINTTFATPSDPFEYGCLTDAFSVSGYVRNENDTPIPGITVASDSGRTAVTDADGYYVLPGLVTGTYTIVPTRTGYTFLPETGAASVPPSVTGLDFTGNGPSEFAVVVTNVPFDETDNRYEMSLLPETGWYAENAIIVDVTVPCPSDNGSACIGGIELALDSLQNDARFYVPQASLLLPEDEVICQDGGFMTECVRGDLLVNIQANNQSLGTLFSFHSYTFTAAPLEIQPGESATYQWLVWAQPSEQTVLDISARWVDLDNSKTYDDTYNDEASVYIPTANIHPVVFLHGILGSMPPGESVITKWPQQIDEVNFSWTGEPHLDPFTGSYRPLINNLLKMGYEIDKTIFPTTYDWRKSNLESAAWFSQVLEDNIGVNGGGASKLDGIAYVNRDGKADIIVHSMGGMVLRSYLQGMATTGSPANVTVHAYPELQRLEYTGPVPYTGDVLYRDNVNKAIFIATPHRGFPFNYATWEGLTWKDYLDEDVFAVSGGGLTGRLLDHILWPFMVVERYNPDLFQEPCSLYWVLEYIPILANLETAILCPNEVIYKFSHSNPYATDHPGVGSLPEMLPDAMLSPYLVPDSWGRQTNFLLEDLGLNHPDSLATLEQTVGTENIYVLYNDERDTVVSYNVVEPPAPGECPWHDFLPELCSVWDYYSDLQRWSYGLVENPTDNDGNQQPIGDNLIPKESTTLEIGELLDLPDEFNQELVIPETGHVQIAAEETTQDVVGAILTGLVEPKAPLDEDDPNAPNLFPVNTAYVPPAIALNNSDVVLAFLVHSPVDVMVTDPQGRRVGYDPDSGQSINEIPGAYYTGNNSDVEFILIGKEEDGEFTITTTGTGNGDYAVSAHRVGYDRIRPVGIISGTAQPGQVDTAMIEIKDTQLVVEAEAFTSTTSGNEQAWNLMSHLSGYTGTGYLKVGPDRGVLYSDANLDMAPELQYELNFSITGTYHIWLRGSGANGAGDSVYVALVKQGEAPMMKQAISGFPPNQWGWSKQTLAGSSAAVSVDTPGSYTLYIWPREDGVRLDRILLSNDTTYYFPVGIGPPGSRGPQ